MIVMHCCCHVVEVRERLISGFGCDVVVVAVDHVVIDMLIVVMMMMMMSGRRGVLYVVEVVHAAVDEAVLAQAELVAGAQLSLAHEAFEAGEVKDEIACAHDQLVRRERLTAAVAFPWKPSFQK
jgi:hypothetical protein